MKELKQIKREAEKGDYTTVARITGVSASLVRMVVYGNREDYYNIQRVFSNMLRHRERLTEQAKRAA